MRDVTSFCERESIIDRDGIIHDGSDSKGGISRGSADCITRAGIDTQGG